MKRDPFAWVPGLGHAYDVYAVLHGEAAARREFGIGPETSGLCNPEDAGWTSPPAAGSNPAPRADAGMAEISQTRPGAGDGLPARAELGVADDLLHPLMADANQRGNGATGHARRGSFTDRGVSVFFGVGVALSGSFEAFFGGHKMQSSLLDTDRQHCL